MRKTLHRSALGEHLQTLARYNLWATRRLLTHVAVLPDEHYRRDLGLFFKSVHGTLNHLLVGEHLLWFARFAEGRSDVHALDEEAEPDRTRLGERLIDGALGWLPLLDAWPDERLHGTLAYRRMAGQDVVLPFAATLAHVFNHGTHHRGQVTAALTMLGAPSPEIDLVFMLQEESTPP
ncbi:MAG: DinB family protein [Chitinophagaceae bacterium]|nr:DinB family protein [Rubrivivax sp.]